MDTTANTCFVNVDGWMYLCKAAIELATSDYLRGPGDGSVPKRQRNYASGKKFLEEAGLLERVHDKHGIPAHACAAASLRSSVSYGSQAPLSAMQTEALPGT